MSPTVLRVLVAVLALLVGMELGVRLARRKGAPGDTPLQRLTTFWLRGSDGRANYSRATAAAGLIGYGVLVGVVARKFLFDEKSQIEALYAALVATCAMMGINLGQFGLSLNRDTKAQQISAGQNPTPPVPPAPPTTTTTTTTETAPPVRDSGTGSPIS